jgi:hypothetical protein
MRVYCQGELVGTSMHGGKVYCGSCGKPLYKIGQTFALTDTRIKSGHGYQDEGEADDREEGSGRTVAGGAVQA